ncbi:M42 family metallopeptidase [Acidobacteriota bacterium]
MRKTIMLFLIITVLISCTSQEINQSRISAWDLLKELILIPGVSGAEEKVADFIQASLPETVEVKRDDMNNVWFTLGEGHPHLLFLAHTDELGFIVESITPNGTLKVRGIGGFFPLMYEGHSVVVHTKHRPVEGIVSPRENYMQRDAQSLEFSTQLLEVYLGVSNEEEVLKLGIAEGDPITIRKEIVELSDNILASRAIDDRAGCAALLAAALRIDWTKFKGKMKSVTFAWDVQEEIGLNGASRLAEIMDVDYVFPVDTFVSSDGPFDSKRYAHIPLGSGAVVRAVDTSNIAPQIEFKKVMDIARQNNIPAFLGNTRGGNDGSVFVSKGTVDIPLSWPGTYSHSFIEKIHSHDLDALVDLIMALVEDW